MNKNDGNDFTRTAILNVSGPAENRTLVQTSTKCAFYMCSRLLIVGKRQANLQANFLRSY